MKKISLQTIINFLALNFLLTRNALADLNLEPITGLDTGWQPEDIGEGTLGDAGTKLENILSAVIGFLTILSGLYFFVMFIVGGLTWASAGGDSGKVENAKNRMTNGVIGLVIVIAAYSVIYIVGEVLGIDILNPATILEGLRSGGSSTSGPNEVFNPNGGPYNAN